MRAFFYFFWLIEMVVVMPMHNFTGWMALKEDHKKYISQSNKLFNCFLLMLLLLIILEFFSLSHNFVGCVSDLACVLFCVTTLFSTKINWITRWPFCLNGKNSNEWRHLNFFHIYFFCSMTRHTTTKNIHRYLMVPNLRHRRSLLITTK